MTVRETEPPGAQPERTRLAWRRTVLTATVVALLALRQAVIVPSVTARVLVAVVMLLWLAALVTGHRRITTLGREDWDGGAGTVRRLPGRAPAVFAAVTCGLALAGMGLLTVD